MPFELTNINSWRGSWDKRLAIFVLPLIILVFYITAAGHFSYTPDDTYIYLQFAKNVIHGNGISFNAGEPVYGVTGMLWLFLISAGGSVGVNLLLAAKALDLFLASMALVVFFFLAFEIMRDAILSLFATLVFSMNVWYMRWAGTGMDTSLAVLLLLATVWFCLRNEYFLSVVFGALTFLVRPEAALLLPLILIDVYMNSFQKKRALQFMLSLALIWFALLLPWELYAYHTFGSILPLTMLAKSGAVFDPKDAWATLIKIGKTLSLSDGVTGILLVFSVLFHLLRTKPDLPTAGEKAEGFYYFRQGFVPLGWTILLIQIYAATSTNTVSRYLVMCSPFIIIFAFTFFYRFVAGPLGNAIAYSAIVAITAIVLLQNQMVYTVLVKPGIEAFEEGMESSLIPMGKWFASNSPADAVVFAPDIGAVGYYSDRRICDASGLITPAMLRYVREGYSIDRIISEHLYRKVCHANYLIHRSRQLRELEHTPGLTALFSKVFVQADLTSPKPYFYTVYKVEE